MSTLLPPASGDEYATLNAIDSVARDDRDDEFRETTLLDVVDESSSLSDPSLSSIDAVESETSSVLEQSTLDIEDDIDDLEAEMLALEAEIEALDREYRRKMEELQKR